MPDNLDELLTDLAREVGGSVPVPSVSAVRRRGAQRAARRRLTGAVLALVLFAIAAGTAEAIIVPHGRASAPTTGATPSVGRHSAPASPGAPSASASTAPKSQVAPPSTSSTPGGQPSDSAGTNAVFSVLVGQWQPADGVERYLIIYPDGVLGIGQAGGGGQPLCAGRVHAPSNGIYPISVACSDDGTSGLSLSVGNGELTLNTAATSSHPAYHDAWVRAQTQSTVAGDGTATLPPWLVATWAMDSNPTYETFTVAADGTVTWTLESQLGGVTHGTATIEPLPDGTFRVHATTGGPATGGFWQFAHLTDGQLQVIGGYGPNAFHVATASP